MVFTCSASSKIAVIWIYTIQNECCQQLMVGMKNQQKSLGLMRMRNINIKMWLIKIFFVGLCFFVSWRGYQRRNYKLYYKPWKSAQRKRKQQLLEGEVFPKCHNSYTYTDKPMYLHPVPWCVSRLIFLLQTFSLWGVSFNNAEFVLLLELFSPLTNVNEDSRDCCSGKTSEYSKRVLSYTSSFFSWPSLNIVEYTPKSLHKSCPKDF